MKKEIDQPETLVHLNACRTSSLLLLNLINSIIDFSQISNNLKLKLAYSQVGIKECLNEIRSLFDYISELKGLSLDVEIDQDVQKTLITDKIRLNQVIISLLGNAFKFTFKGGVTLKVSMADDDQIRVRFSVIDTGIEIKKEDQVKLFKLFGKVEQKEKKDNTQGIGLGLTISNKLL